MTEPSKKSEEVEEVIKGLMGVDRREVIKSNTCVPPPIGCGGPATEFKDDLSRREYSISGLCQACQDKVFGEPEEE